jgi:alpha-galactosidase
MVTLGMRETLLSKVFGDTLVRYPLDRDTGMVGLELIPIDMVGETVTPRESLRGEAFIDVLPGDDPWPARPVESLLQLKLVGDSYPGAFAQGHTLRNSGTVAAFRF